MLIHHDIEDNWSALAVAICYKKPLTVEAAFQVYQTGTTRKREESTKRVGRQTFKEIDGLRKAGYRWREINQMLCLRDANSFYWHHYKDWGSREYGREKLLDPSDARAAAGTSSRD